MEQNGLGSLSGQAECILCGYGKGYPDALTGTLEFSWEVRGLYGKQDAYRLKVWKQGENELVWDSGWNWSSTQTGVSYEGKPFVSNCDYEAEVSVKISGDLQSSGRVRFSTGFLKRAEWKAVWLKQHEAAGTSAPMFRREFIAENIPKRARLFISGLGYYEAYLNGKRVGDHILDPAWTDFDKRISYVAYDVKEMLLEGKNVIGILLGHGWYGGLKKVLDPCFTMRLIMEFENGSISEVSSGSTRGWLCTSSGPIREESIYDGELYDARDEMAGWSTREYHIPHNGSWLTPLVAEPPEGLLEPQDLEPIRAVKILDPALVTHMEDGTDVVDFGCNIAGVVRINIREPEGTKIVITHAEILDRRGRPNRKNLRKAKACDTYISPGNPAVYQPRFTYHGFRYVQVEGLSEALRPEDIKAVVLRSDVAVRSRFECSDSLVNRIQEMCFQTESNNLHGVPTDCPQRDERQGWLNDLTVRAEEAVYNFEMARFFGKYAQDIADTQGKSSGAIKDTAPYLMCGKAPADPVCSSYLNLPWLIYEHYGIKSILQRFYPGLARWTKYLQDSSENGIVSWGDYGDWASPITESDKSSYGAGAVSKNTPIALMSTGFLYYNQKLLEKIALITGKASESEKWGRAAQRTKLALNREFYNKEKGYYATGSQGANVFMLYLGVVLEEERERVLKNLEKDIKAHRVHLTTGNICTKYLPEVLADNGRIDLAYALVTQTTYPSWGYMLSKGATTAWERWEYVDHGWQLEMASHDHPMYATISAWFYKYLLGIQPLEAGFGTFQVRPYFPIGLKWARGNVHTVRGMIEVSWEKKDICRDGQKQLIQVEIKVPFNSKCSFSLSEAEGEIMADGEIGSRVMELDSGVHNISIFLPQNR